MEDQNRIVNSYNLGYYAAKFEREAKKNPSDWCILPQFRGDKTTGYNLIYVGESNDSKE